MFSELLKKKKKKFPSQGTAMSQITSLLCSDDFKETKKMKQLALWHSELELMHSVEIYGYIWGKKEVFLFSVLNEATAALTERLITGFGCLL